MALAPLPSNTTPDVPPSSGVPTLFRTNPVSTAYYQAVLLETDVIGTLGLFLGPQWGVFNFVGQPLVVPDTFLTFDYRAEARIADFPTEDGAFQSYDKVQMPFDIRVQLGCDGTNMGKDQFLAACQAAEKSLDLYHVITPDADFRWVNVAHIDVHRERTRGGGILIVDLWLQEIQQNASATYTNTKQPEGASQVNGGSVQPTSAPTNVSASGFHLGGT